MVCECIRCKKEYNYFKGSSHTTKRCSSCMCTMRRQRYKAEFRRLLGDCCSVCGYNKCVAALHFHHLNPEEKEFIISHSKLSYEKQLEEVNKCILLCSNCHQELHHPEYNGLL